MVLEVVHRAPGGDDVAARQGNRLVGHRVEHLRQLRVVDAQQCPLHPRRNLPPTDRLAQGVRVNPEGEGVEDQIGPQGARGLSVGSLSGRESSVSRGPVNSGRLGLWQVGVMDVDAGGVTVGWDVIDRGVVDLKMNSPPGS